MSASRTIVALTAVGLLAGPMQVSAWTVSVLNNGDFETPFSSPLATTFTSAMYGKWAVGDAAQTTASANGIAPLGGSLMMDFLPVPVGNISSDVYQVVDLTAYATQIDAGLVTADLSVYYNSTYAASAGMSIWRYLSPPTSFGGAVKLAGTYDMFQMDSNKSTWQQFGIDDVLLTAGTRYVIFGLNHPAPAAAAAYQTYADNASLVLTINDVEPVPLPAAAWLLLSGLGGLSVLGRRRKAA